MERNPSGFPRGPQGSAAPGHAQGGAASGHARIRAARAPALHSTAPPPALGVGFPWVAGLPDWLYRRELVDFVELTPETLCREAAGPGGRRLVLQAEAVAGARATCEGLPMVVHGVELSIGSTAGWNDAWLDMVEDLQGCWPFEWLSEHLGFQTVREDGGTIADLGVPLPMPATAASAALVKRRCRILASRFGVPVLLENPAHYFAEWPAEPGIGDEIGLMNRITQDGPAWQLLDLHNLYCNAVNLGLDIEPALQRLRLDRVLEIHVAGGMWQQGWWADAHCGRVPEPVWRMLEEVLPRCPQVRGVVFEVLDQYAPLLAPTLLAGQLERARAVWQSHGPAGRAPGCPSPQAPPPVDRSGAAPLAADLAS